MLSNPIVEELVLAALTAELAMEQCTLDMETSVMATPNGVFFGFGTIRICPPLKVAKRFRAFVTWLPIGKAGR